MPAKKAIIQSRNRAQQNRLQVIEEMRSALPLDQYLLLIHQGIMEGQIPILGRDGRPTGEFTPLTGKERLDLIMRMTNKALPDRPTTPGEMGEAEPTLDEIQAIASDPDEIKLLTVEQLEEMEQSIKQAKKDK